MKAYIDEHLADNPSLNIAVLGDWNGFYFEDAQTQLTDPAKGGVLTNLNNLLPAEERYSYLFEGNAQQIDNILVTGGLATNAQYDSVHINSQFGGDRPTDHDPQVALLQPRRGSHEPRAQQCERRRKPAGGHDRRHAVCQRHRRTTISAMRWSTMPAGCSPSMRRPASSRRPRRSITRPSHPMPSSPRRPIAAG